MAVGTRNPSKLGAVKDALARCGLPWEVVAAPVPSGVSDQPLSAEETLRGARQRASAALAALPGADLAVGLEGGLLQVGEDWFEAGWIALEDREGRRCAAPSVGFLVPPALVPHLLQGRDLNQAVEHELGIPDIGEGAGLMGHLSGGVVTRSDAYCDALVMALARWRSPQLWGERSGG